jgi:hypothetical protein
MQVGLLASRIAFGKCCNRARNGLLRCFINIPHAKVTRALIFSLGRVFVSVRGLLGDEQAMACGGLMIRQLQCMQLRDNLKNSHKCKSRSNIDTIVTTRRKKL